MFAIIGGVVHPMSEEWSFDHQVSIRFDELDWVVTVRHSQFHVFVTGPEPKDLATYINEISAVVQSLLDSFGFHLGAALRGEITSVIIDGKRVIYPRPRWPELVGGKLESSVPVDVLEPFFRAAASHPSVRLALADLSAAITTFEETTFLAYRAVESVRQWFVESDLSPRTGRVLSWVRLREELGVDEGATRKLEELSKRRRHGEFGRSYCA